MTVLKLGGKFSKGAYQTSGGLHGVGVSLLKKFVPQDKMIQWEAR